MIPEIGEKAISVKLISRYHLVFLPSLFLFLTPPVAGQEIPRQTSPEAFRRSYTIDERYLLGCDLYNEGVRSEKKNEYEKALIAFNKATQLLPKDHPGYILAKIEIQRLTNPLLKEEKKKRYRELLALKVAEQLREVQKEAIDIVAGLAIKSEIEQEMIIPEEKEKGGRSVEERLNLIARQIALQTAIEHFKRQTEKEKEIAFLLGILAPTTPGEPPAEFLITEEEEKLLEEKIKAAVEAL